MRYFLPPVVKFTRIGHPTTPRGGKDNTAVRGLGLRVAVSRGVGVRDDRLPAGGRVTERIMERNLMGCERIMGRNFIKSELNDPESALDSPWIPQGIAPGFPP